MVFKQDRKPINNSVFPFQAFPSFFIQLFLYNNISTRILKIFLEIATRIASHGFSLTSCIYECFYFTSVLFDNLFPLAFLEIRGKLIKNSYFLFFRLSLIVLPHPSLFVLACEEIDVYEKCDSAKVSYVFRFSFKLNRTYFTKLITPEAKFFDGCFYLPNIPLPQ